MEAKKVNKRNLSGYTGVSTNASGNSFARIKINGDQVFLGTYKTPEEASAAHDTVARLKEKYTFKAIKPKKKGK